MSTDSEDLDSAIRRLRTPAGDDPRFATWEKCLENNRALSLIIHRVFKELHFGTFLHIIAADGFLDAASKKPGLRSRVPAIKDYRLLWRRVNDSLVWVLLRQQRHLMKRLCFYREHGYLAFQNYDSMVALLKALNAPETSLAIWTDATSCVDVGDVVLSDRNSGSLVIAEAKEGKVNNEILTLQMDDRDAVFAFLDRYGSKGAKQVERVMRQAQRVAQVVGIMSADKGVDPLTGQNITVADHGVPEKSYDEELDTILDTAMADGSTCQRVGNSLWIYAFQCTADAHKHHRLFSQTVTSQCDQGTHSWLQQCTGRMDVLPVVSLRDGLGHPATLPLYLRGFSTEHILSIVHRKLHVLLFFDWAGFGLDIAARGAAFRWSTRKQGRRAGAKPKYERPLMIGDYIPQVHLEDMCINLGAPPFLHVLFGGLSPDCYAEMCVASFDLLREKGNN